MSSSSFLSQIRKGHSSGTSRLLKELANKYQKIQSANVVVQDENLTDEGITLRNRILIRDKLRYIKQTTTIPLFYTPYEPDGEILKLWLKANQIGGFIKDYSRSTGSTRRVVGTYNFKPFCIVDSGGLDLGYHGTYNGLESSPCWALNNSVVNSELNQGGAAIPINNDLDIKDTDVGISLTAWVKVSDFSQHFSTNRRIMSKTDDADNSYVLFVFSNNSVAFSVKYDGSEYKVVSPATLTTDTWYLIVATFDSSTQTAKIYVNGTVSTTSFAVNVTYINPTDTNLNLFCNSGDDSGTLFGAFSGYCRDLRLYREKVLTQQEVTNFWTNKNTISDIDFGSVPMAGYFFSPGTMELSSFTSTSFTNQSFNL